MVKINIISGFLGAGKTTLIKKMLAACSEEKERVVIIENEFGKIGIDGELVRKEGFEVYELSSGCICCTLRTDFMHTLSEIIEKLNPDRIIFEPSGIIILSDVLNTLKMTEFAVKCHISSLITIADGINYLKYKAKAGPFFTDQLENATTLVVSKSQLITPEAVEIITANLRSVNKDAEIITKNWDSLSHSDMMDLLDGDLERIMASLLHECHCEHCECSKNHNNHTHHNHVDNHGYDNIGVDTLKIFTPDELNEILNDLKNEEYGDVIRAKGFLKTEEGYLEFSYINGQYTVTPGHNHLSGKACFIGQKLKREKLLGMFKD